MTQPSQREDRVFIHIQTWNVPSDTNSTVVNGGELTKETSENAAEI